MAPFAAERQITSLPSCGANETYAPLDGRGIVRRDGDDSGELVMVCDGDGCGGLVMPGDRDDCDMLCTGTPQAASMLVSSNAATTQSDETGLT